MVSPRDLRQLLKRYGIEPRRSWGQNFLIDGNVLQRIIAAAELVPGEPVVEIGPGPGVLTERLLAAGTEVWAIELDRQLSRLLAERFAGELRFHLIQQDVLTVAWPALWEQMGQPERVKVVANIPYSITSPLLLRLREEAKRWERAVLLVQKEVADRLTARAGTKEYGALSVAIRSRFAVERLATVPPTVFLPAPQVYSALIRLTPLAQPLDQGVEGIFRELTRAAFSQRRKMLRAALKGLAVPAEAWTSVSIDAERRGETLTPQEFASLSRVLASLPGWRPVRVQDDEAEANDQALQGWG